MATEVVKKKRISRTCGKCGEEVEKNLDACPADGSEDIKKSLVIVTKATGDDEDDLDEAVEDQLDDEADEDEDEDDDENEDDEDEDEDEDDEDDEDEEDEVEPEPLTEVGKKVMAVESLNLATSLAEKITKIFSGKNISKADKKYEQAMTDFNEVMDAAAETWLTGASVSKSSETSAQAALIQKRVTKIIKEGGAKMPKKQRPDGLKIDELPDEVKSYISSLESGDDDDVEKADIYKGLTPAAAKIVKESAALIEKNTTEKYQEIAKKFTHVPGDKIELAKSLRTLAETDSAAYKTMVDSLEAAQANLEQGDIFKSYGRPGNQDEGETDITKRAKEAVAKGDYPTIEQAEVALMDGSAYKPTA